MTRIGISVEIDTDGRVTSVQVAVPSADTSCVFVKPDLAQAQLRSEPAPKKAKFLKGQRVRIGKGCSIEGLVGRCGTVMLLDGDGDVGVAIDDWFGHSLHGAIETATGWYINPKHLTPI